jgi:hypothetical protein
LATADVKFYPVDSTFQNFVRHISQNFVGTTDVTKDSMTYDRFNNIVNCKPNEKVVKEQIQKQNVTESGGGAKSEPSPKTRNCRVEDKFGNCQNPNCKFDHKQKDRKLLSDEEWEKVKSSRKTQKTKEKRKVKAVKAESDDIKTTLLAMKQQVDKLVSSKDEVASDQPKNL